MKRNKNDWVALLDSFERHSDVDDSIYEMLTPQEPSQIPTPTIKKFCKTAEGVVIKDAEQPKTIKKVAVRKHKKRAARKTYNFNMLYIDKSINNSYNNYKGGMGDDKQR
ncbi:MAG: hypothetical protein E7485_08715 [Ruminococcaceae bacterium]|nr:hypothetical protein [Oscillospiraceae bacterium]